MLKTILGGLYNSSNKHLNRPRRTIFTQNRAMSSRVFDLKDKGACVVGAGLAGSLLAIVLAKRGMNVHLIERRADMRKEVTDRGRSINLALSERGINALKHSDIIEKIMGIAIPMKGRLVHPLGNIKTIFSN